MKFDGSEEQLDIIREINESYKTYDIHLHPLEIISNSLVYREHPKEKGLYSINGGQYMPPSLKMLPNDETVEKMTNFLHERPEMLPMLNRKTYSHTGPKVFRAHFDILGLEISSEFLHV